MKKLVCLMFVCLMFSGCAWVIPMQKTTTTYTVADGQTTILADGTQVRANSVLVQKETPTGIFGPSDNDKYVEGFEADRAARKDMIGQCSAHFGVDTPIPDGADTAQVALISMANLNKSLMYKECVASVTAMPFGLKKPRTLQDNIGSAIGVTPYGFFAWALKDSGGTRIDNRDGKFTASDSFNTTKQTSVAGQNGTASGAISTNHDNPTTSTEITELPPTPPVTTP